VFVSGPGPHGYAWNRTRQTYLATRLELADSPWSRLRGLIGREARAFARGQGLWLVPCRGVHTLGMSFAIDVVYLTGEGRVLHLETGLPPWRFAPVRRHAATVLELPANTLETTRTAVGDEIEIKA
jgi:uncharacterized membrane protein (UPF0127 family)